MARLNGKYGRQVRGFSPEAMDRLTRFDWPGNVRQLEHAVEHAFAVTPASEAALPLKSLPPEVGQVGGVPSETSARRPAAPADERAAVEDALARAGGNKAQAARLLGITRAGLYKKLKRLRIET